MGFDHFYVGPELEYFLFRDNRSTEVLDEGGYFDLTTLDAGSDVRRDTVLALEKFGIDRKSTRLNSSHANISYAVFCLKKKQYISGYRATDGASMNNAAQGSSIVITGADLGGSVCVSCNVVAAIATSWSAIAIER